MLISAKLLYMCIPSSSTLSAHSEKSLKRSLMEAKRGLFSVLMKPFSKIPLKYLVTAFEVQHDILNTDVIHRSRSLSSIHLQFCQNVLLLYMCTNVCCKSNVIGEGKRERERERERERSLLA